MSSFEDQVRLAEPVLRSSRTQGGLLVVDGSIGDCALIEALAGAGDLEIIQVHAEAWALIPDGVARASAPDYLGAPGGGGPDATFCTEAVGEGPGARLAWADLRSRWAGDTDDDLPLPPDDEPFRRGTEVLARILAEVGEISPRLLVVRSASSLDSGSARALAALIAGRGGAGWVVALEGPLDGGSPAELLCAAVERATGGDSVVHLEPPDAAESEAPGLPQRGSAVELLDLLSAAPVALPVQVVGSASLAAYRGCAPRAGWLDLQGLLDSGRATLEGPMLRLDGDWSPSTDAGGVVALADCRALRDAVEDVLAEGDPLRVALEAELARAGGADDAADRAAEAGRAALLRGDAHEAARWLARATSVGDPELPALRARAARLARDADGARALAQEGLGSSPPERAGALLHLEAGVACEQLGREAAATRHYEEAAELADRADEPTLLAASKLARGRQQEEAGDFGPAARTLGDAAQACERLGLGPEAARALARRAVCMGKAGAGPRAMKELGLARERAADPDDPNPAALDVRILMGVVFRDSGSRENARKALALAADKAAEHADPVREAEARLMLGRFFLEAVPVKGVERGEALRDARETAEAVVRISRGMGRDDLEASGEALLGELSYRAEDWVSALESLGRQQALWAAVGRASKEVDVAIRRSRIATRRGDHEQAFKAANEGLTLATRRRLPEQSAQAQLARADALQKLDRSADALAALAEAQRIYTSLGEAFRGQAAAAEQRAQQLVADNRGA